MCLPHPDHDVPMSHSDADVSEWWILCGMISTPPPLLCWTIWIQYLMMVTVIQYYTVRIHMSSASPRGGGGNTRENVGTLQTSSVIAPPTRALVFIRSPTLSPAPGALQFCKYHANKYEIFAFQWNKLQLHWTMQPKVGNKQQCDEWVKWYFSKVDDATRWKYLLASSCSIRNLRLARQKTFSSPHKKL